jgi:hypothetical protein
MLNLLYRFINAVVKDDGRSIGIAGQVEVPRADFEPNYWYTITRYKSCTLSRSLTPKNDLQGVNIKTQKSDRKPNIICI